MAATLDVTFEGQTSGTTVTTANSDDFGDKIIDALVGTGGAATYDNTHTAKGALSLRFTPSSTASYYARYELENGFTAFAVRFYVYITGLPSATVNFPTRILNTAAGNMIQVLMLTDGRLRTQSSDGATTLATTTGTLAVNTMYRIEFQGSGLGTAATTVSLQAFAGDSTTPITGMDITTTGFTTTGTGRYVAIGKSSTATVAEHWFDALSAASGTSTPLGPAPAATHIYRVVSVTNGSAPVLGGAGATRTFHAPGLIPGTVITIGYKANDAASETQLPVTVLPVTERAVTGGAEVPAELQVIA